MCKIGCFLWISVIVDYLSLVFITIALSMHSEYQSKLVFHMIV